MYTYLKAFHIIIDIGWIAGLLIYPRYKIHQMQSQSGDDLFEVMRAASIRLRNIILTPTLVLAWITGLSLIALNPDVMGQGWIHGKLLLVLILSALHGSFIGIGKKIDAGNYHNTKVLKLMNEIPFILMAIVVILAIVKPF